MGQCTTSSTSTRTAPVVGAGSRHRRRPDHDEGHFLARLGEQARWKAERAVLELDVLGTDRRRIPRLVRGLNKRQDATVTEWEAAAAMHGLPLDDIAAERVRHLRRSFRDRVRELLAAAGPGGRA